MAGAVTVVGVAGAAAALTVALTAVGGAAITAQRAAHTADSAALAAADAASGAIGGFPCEQASRIAETAGMDVASCEVDGLIATVALSASLGPLLVSATSRAGPPP